MAVDVHNLLLGLAWLGEASTAHVRRLWIPTATRQWVRMVLNELRDEGYVDCRRWAQPRNDRPTPIRQDALWSLTRKGRERLKESAAKIEAHRRQDCRSDDHGGAAPTRST